MTVLDAYAALAFLREEPGADEVAGLLRRGPTVMSAANVAEVVDQLLRVHRRDPYRVHADLMLLTHAGLDVLPITAYDGIAAGRLRSRHYHRERCAVSLADCVAAATALALRRPLATADPALARLVREEGGEIHALADSEGVKP